MELHKTFNSYDDLQSAIDSFEKENRVQFWKRDAKTLKSAEHHSPKLFKKAPQELRYYKLKYACIHGGQEFRPKNKKASQRNHQGTLKKNCQAHITIGLNADGKSLIVKNMSNEHNHEIPSEELFKQLPKQRRLNSDTKETVKMMMKLKVNKKLLQADLVKKSGTNILLKDLSNIYTTSQNLNSSFEDIIKKLIVKYNCTVDFKTEDTKFCALFFQDFPMKKSFSLFPEILFMEGTYKLINIRCPVYVMAVENSLGTTDVVGIGILLSENIENISWMLQKFKERNDKWEEIQVIMTDKCAAERQAIAEQLPNASKLICIFHALQIFRREVTVTKLNITSEEVVFSLQLLQKIAYAKSEAHYVVLLEKMRNSAPKPVLEYYIKNWHDIRTEWVKGLTSKTGNFLNTTNNRLESLNSKLKSVISTYSTFDEIIEKLFVLLNIKRTQFQNELSKMVFKSPYMVDKIDAEKMYNKHLTQFAFSKIKNNLMTVYSTDVSTQYNFIYEGSKVICCSNKSKNTKYEVSDVTCNCCFFTSMKLPCIHVLFYRKQLGLDLFEENLFSPRWAKNYINNDISNYVSNSELPITETRLLTPTVNRKKPLTSHQKYKKSDALCLKIATLCSEVSTEEFYNRMKLLSELQNKWQNHDKVSLESNSNQENQLVEHFYDSEINLEHNYCGGAVVSNEGVTNTNKRTYSDHRDDMSELDKIIGSVECEDDSELIEIDNEEIYEQEEIGTDINLQDISLPDSIKCRGRPRGLKLTVVGLPKKKM